MKKQVSYGCQQVLLHPDKKTKAILEYICRESNKLYNCALYYSRQVYFKTRRIVSKFDLDKIMKVNLHFKALRSCVAQQTCHSVAEGIKSFKALVKLQKKGELKQKPKPPNYRKKGLYQVAYPRTFIKQIDDSIELGLGKQTKVWFGIDKCYIPMPSNLNFKDLKEVRIIPRNKCFYAEYVYQLEPIKSQVDKSKVLGIDHGLNNWLTCVSNIGTSFIVDGLKLKSCNNWYNKQVSVLKENKPQGFWNNRLAFITEKRNRQMRDAVNKAAKLVVNHCKKNQIGRVIFGWNEEQKQNSNMGRKNNQKFVSIPTARLKDRIKQLCDRYGIDFLEVSESYTSKSSFLDNDSIPEYGEKPKDWKPSGKRIHRGLYRSAKGYLVNADANAAANLLKKVSTILGDFDLDRVSMGVLTRPQRLCVFGQLEKIASSGFNLACNLVTESA